MWSDAPIRHRPPLTTVGAVFDLASFRQVDNELRGLRTKALNTFRDQTFGPYLALEVVDNDTLRVFRDPSGGAPCYYLQTEHSFWLASDVDLLFTYSGVRPSLSLPGLIEHLRRPEFQGEGTCLNVKQVRPGGQMDLKLSGEVRTFLFPAPSALTPPEPHRSYDEIKAELRTLILKSIKASASEYQQVVVSLSGGLDSSVVAAGLAQTSTKVSLQTFKGPDAKGDETAFALACADYLGLSLEVATLCVEDVDLSTPISPHLPRPSTSFFLPSLLKGFSRCSQTRSGGAIFSGNGGDSVFCFMHSATPLSDLLCKPSGLERFRKTWADVQQLTRASATDVLARALKTAMTRGYTWPENDLLLSCDAASSRLLPDPVLSSFVGKLPGRLRHLALIRRAYNTFEPFPPWLTPPVIHPLMAKPIQAFCLSVPSWMWVSGGRDRALVRDAFEGLLPDSVRLRKSKGSPAGFLHALYRAKGRQMIELIRYGYLRREGIIDISPNSLFSDGFRNPRVMHRIFELAATEVWVEHWRNWRPRRV